MVTSCNFIIQCEVLNLPDTLVAACLSDLSIPTFPVSSSATLVSLVLEHDKFTFTSWPLYLQDFLLEMLFFLAFAWSLHGVVLLESQLFRPNYSLSINVSYHFNSIDQST